MKQLLSTVMIISLCGQSAQAVQTCPPGNPRVAPNSRYSENGNGTVTDHQTGLMWKQCMEGQAGTGCMGSATTMNWSAALAAGANSNFSGFNDWRLPNVKELQSLVETGCYLPPINEQYFPNSLTPDSPFARAWSSTTYEIATDAWYVDLGIEGVVNPSLKTTVYKVRLVRSEQ